MGKNKLVKFAEYDAHPFTFDATCALKGKWNKELFGNDNPIVLELACGKGDYTVNLAQMFPDRNFIGIDRKGSRMWRGAKTVEEKGLKNVAFLRIQIENLINYFENGEVSEIWITFPDPHPPLGKAKKRLTSTRFLPIYRSIMGNGGIVNLKTDSPLMYEFTLETAAEQQLEVIQHHADIYSWAERPEVLNIRTFYENMWLEEGRLIKYVKFKV